MDDKVDANCYSSNLCFMAVAPLNQFIMDPVLEGLFSQKRAFICYWFTYSCDLLLWVVLLLYVLYSTQEFMLAYLFVCLLMAILWLIVEKYFRLIVHIKLN